MSSWKYSAEDHEWTRLDEERRDDPRLEAAWFAQGDLAELDLAVAGPSLGDRGQRAPRFPEYDTVPLPLVDGLGADLSTAHERQAELERYARHLAPDLYRRYTLEQAQERSRPGVLGRRLVSARRTGAPGQRSAVGSATADAGSSRPLSVKRGYLPVVAERGVSEVSGFIRTGRHRSSDENPRGVVLVCGGLMLSRRVVG